VVRGALANALPNAPRPEVQAVREPSILHTTVARLLKPPFQKQVGRKVELSGPTLLKAAVDAMTAKLCGLETELTELWYIQEDDLLALALNGHYRKQRLPLRCPRAV
jgi:hypothetical protein